MALSTKSPTSATGTGWTTPSNFDGNTAGAGTISVAAGAQSNPVIGANLGFDAAIPVGSVINQVRCRVYWTSSSCVSGGIDSSYGLHVSGVNKGGAGSETCKTAGSWAPWYTCTGSWTRADLLNGTLTLLADGFNNHVSTARTLSAFAGEVEVTYTPPGGSPQVCILMS